MKTSFPALLAVGVTATAVVAAPSMVLKPRELQPTVVAADVAPMNAASDLINSVYGVSRYWANYASLELAPWALGWVPFGYLVTDQIYIWYPGGGWQPGFVLPVTDSFVNDLLDPVVNNPLDLGLWGSGVRAVAGAAADGVVGGINNEIRYALSLDWLPFPLPPLPSQAAVLQSELTDPPPPIRALVQTARAIAGDVTLGLQARVDQIAALLRDGSDRIVPAGLPSLDGVDRSHAPRFAPAGVLEGHSADRASLVDVALPEQKVDEPESDTTKSDAPAQLAEHSEKPAGKKLKRADRSTFTTPKKALAAANEARRESAKKTADTVREGAKSLREGLRKVTGKRSSEPSKSDTETSSEKERADNSEASSD